MKVITANPKILYFFLKNNPKIYLFYRASLFYIYLYNFNDYIEIKLMLTVIDFNLPPTDFSHPPTAFFLPIPGRDVYFLLTANLNNYLPHWSSAQKTPCILHLAYN